MGSGGSTGRSSSANVAYADPSKSKTEEDQKERKESVDVAPVIEVKKGPSPATPTVAPGQTPLERKKIVSITGANSDISKKYKIDSKELGRGHYGTVCLGTHVETGEKFAIKTMRKDKLKRLEIIRREIDILKTVDHPNIIKLYEVYEDDRLLHLVTELCTGGELFDRIIERGHYSERDASTLMWKITDALVHCHNKDICHRDLKPENFLFTSPAEDADVKVIDFGLGRLVPEEAMTTRVGTPYYIAPEVLGRHYDKSCDIWSLGVIMYILLCGYPPFAGATDQEILSRVKHGKFQMEGAEWDMVSTHARGLLKRMLNLEPTSRPTAVQVMEDEWFKRFPPKHVAAAAATAAAAAPSADTAAAAPAADPAVPTAPAAAAAAAAAVAPAAPAAADAAAAAGGEGSNSSSSSSSSSGEVQAKQRRKSRRQSVSLSMLHGLRHFAAINKMKRLVCNLMAEQLTEEELASLQRVFKGLDSDGNGFLSVAQLMQGIDTTGLTTIRDEVHRLVDVSGHAVEMDEAKTIDYNTFVQATMERNAIIRRERLEQTFVHFNSTEERELVDFEALSKVMGSNAHARELLLEMGLVGTGEDGAEGGVEGVSIEFEKFKALLGQQQSFEMGEGEGEGGEAGAGEGAAAAAAVPADGAGTGGEAAAA